MLALNTGPYRVLTGLVLAFVVMALPFVGAAQAGHTLYVAPNGNDAWSGALDTPNADATDGPLETIEGAQDAVAKIKAGRALTEPVKIWIRRGNYYQEGPIVFGPEDSGTAVAPVSFEAYPGESPVLHGGRRLTGWQQEGHYWTMTAPELASGAWTFSALWVNGRRATAARTPNPTNEAGDYPEKEDFFYADGPVMEKNAEEKEVNSSTRFRYQAGDVEAWESMEGAEFVLFHSWATSIHKVAGLDAENRIVTFTGPARWPLCRWKGNQWYFVQNLFEALDQPGECHINAKTGKVCYIPREGEDMTSAEVIAPVATQLIRLEGNPVEGAYVEHLHFKGLKLHYTEHTIGPKGHSDGQAEYSVGAAFEGVGARYCVVDRCEFAHLGTYGLWWRRGSQQCSLQHSEIVDTGAGGVRLGEGGDAATLNEVVGYNTVDNNYLHDGGRTLRSAVGVWIGRSSYNTVSHNDICDYRYSGVSVGWSWGYRPSSAHHNYIEYNRIHDCGKGQLSDMGGIYCLGKSPGTVLRNNYIYDILSNPNVSGGWGLYTDEGSSKILMENNIIHHTRTGTFHQHYGENNLLRNNILAFSEREQIIRSRDEDHCSFILDGNIIYFSNGRLLGSRWGNGNWRSDNNLFWDSSGMEMDFAGRSFEEWQAQGYDQDSKIADPLFEDIEGRNFALKEDSPALAMGFKPIDITEIGLYGEAAWVGKPGLVARRPFEAPKPPAPETYQDDFEAIKVGDRAPGAQTNGEAGSATIRVSDEHAASGSHSLKLTDAKGLDKRYNPHLVYTPHFRSGVIVGEFDLRLEPGVILYHQWRDNHSPYRVGPSLSFGGDGTMRIGSELVEQLPVQTWLHFRIECALGQASTGTWKLTLTLPDGAEKVFPDLALTTPQFKRLDWLGFVMDGDDDGSAYLDNLNLRVKEK